MNRLLSHYLEFLLGLKQMRPRLLVFLAALGALCGSLAFKDGAPPASRAFLGVIAALCGLALLGAAWCALVGYTLFTREPTPGRRSEQGPGLEPLAEGQGEAGRISGELGNGRHRQRFQVTAGGLLREDQQLHLVIPAQAFQVIGGIGSEACTNWWRCTLGGEVTRVEVGSLWLGGRALPALRFVRSRFDRPVVGIIDPSRFARVLETVRALEYPLA